MIDIENAAPMVYELGTRDVSGRTVPSPLLQFPQHLPVFYTFGSTGPVGRHYVDLSVDTLTGVYSDATFDVTGPYFTHQTPYIQRAAANGNNMVIHRLLGRNASDVANVCFYLDVLPKVVTLYQKNSDGSIKRDEAGQPMPVLDSANQPVTVTNGATVAWVADSVTVPYGEYEIGKQTERRGIQSDGNVQSTQYPIFEVAAEYAGEFAKNLGARLYAAGKSDVVPFPTTLLTEAKVFPYYFQMIKKSSSVAGKVDPVYNGFGAQYSRFVLKPGQRDPSSNAIVDLSTVLKSNYIKPESGYKTGMGAVYVYSGNLTTVSKTLYDKEATIEDQYRDPQINNSEANYFALNILSFTSSNGSPYQAVKLVDLAGSVRMSRHSNHFMGGASDGEMTEALMDQLVADDMENYENEMSPYHDLVSHPESILYDSGFTFQTKLKLPKFISKRKDTFVVLSTTAHDAQAVTLDQQTSVAIALNTMLELYPESSHFGTGSMRGMVMGGAGDLAGSTYEGRVSTAYELLDMASNYMGAANGAWKNGKLFDKAPNSVLKHLTNLDVVWVPNSVRRVLWKNGVNFALNYKVGQQFFPALQTVCADDTSVLNSFFTAVAVCYLNKVAHAAWKDFSGDIEFTPAQLEERVNLFVNEMVKDKFDGQFVIVPECTVTARDELRGYSWTLPIKIYANNMKTVMTTYVQAHRMSDLGETA